MSKGNEHTRALNLSEQKFRHLFEGAMDLICNIDAEGILTDMNPEMVQLTGYSNEYMAGRPFSEFLHDDSVLTWNEIFENLKAGNHEKKFGLILSKKDERKLNVEVSSVPEMHEGKMIGAWLIMRDVTEIRRRSVELDRINRQLIEKNRELEQIVYVTSHDLRSPLVNIQGFNQELEISIQEMNKLLESFEIPTEYRDEIKYITNEEIPEALGFINSGITKMDSLLKGLLTISRLGRRPMEIRKLKMNNMVNEVIQSMEYQVKQSETEMSVLELPDCKADETQLSQVFSNLLDNALKYLDPERKGQIIVSGEEGQDSISYKVSDNGIGIPADKREKVFEIFYRNEQKRPGEGLGLTLVRKIIEKHLGEVFIEPNDNKGTTVTVLLPK